ncbi:hypothetical protein CBM2606_A160128 [Cupriavidus taiwanensis]|nr:hypothetical protein CBM2606_A160128 [Cupriavidus taiwanensis]
MAPVGTGAHYKVYYLALLVPVCLAPHEARLWCLRILLVGRQTGRFPGHRPLSHPPRCRSGLLRERHVP